eukprot:3846356-Rhodomonas_salina.1
MAGHAGRLGGGRHLDALHERAHPRAPAHEKLPARAVVGNARRWRQGHGTAGGGLRSALRSALRSRRRSEATEP